MWERNMMAADAPPAVDAVVVSAARLPTSPADAAFSIVNVDPAALQTFDRVDDIIKTSPSVSLFRRGSSAGANPTVQGVSLRSLAPSGAGRALVTLDGVPQNDPFGNWVIWTSLTPEALSGVSIVRGAGAGPYGAGALTGVVALDEKSAVTGGLIGDVSASDLGARRVALAGSDKVGAVQLFATGATESGDHWIPVRERRGAADSDLTLEDWSTSGKAVIPLGAAALTAHAGAYREARGSGLVGVNSATSGQDAALTLTQQPDPKQLGWKLQAWVRRSDLSNSSGSVSADRSTVTPANSEYKTPATGWGTNAEVRKMGDWGSVEAGFDLRAAGGEESEKSSFVNGAYTKGRVAGGDTLIYGVYAEGAWRIGAWLLTGGARIDEWSTTHGHRIETTLATGAVTLNPVIANKSGSVPTARAGIRRDFGPVYLRTAGYAGFRVPSLNELYRPFRVGNNITEANENLVPEKLYGGEVAVGQDQGPVTWSATGFVNQIKDPILNVTIGYGPATFPRAGLVPAGGIFYMRENAGAINATGVEAEAKYEPIQTVALRLSGAYTNAHVDGQSVDPQLTGKRPAQTPVLAVTGGAEWKATGRLSFNADIRYEGSRFEDDLNTLTLRAAAGVDARVSYQLTRDWGVYLAADNLTDAAIETGQTADHVKSYDEPRVIRVGIRFRE
jgi:outer membrane receptor protein involved in Fe transport